MKKYGHLFRIKNKFDEIIKNQISKISVIFRTTHDTEMKSTVTPDEQRLPFSPCQFTL